jgi:RNA polymerase sigma-70 factor (ECF subfamily)
MAVSARLNAPTIKLDSTDPDAELVAAAKADPSAFLKLYDRYYDRVAGYVRLRVRDTATCEDVTSQVFTSALAGIPRFRGEGSFGGWLFQIARNAVHDAHRRPRTEMVPEELTEAPDLRPGPEQRVLDLERVERLRAVVRGLPDEQQHLLGLRYGAELEYEAIEAIVGGSAGALRVRVHRILEELRRRYPDED